MMNFSHPDQQTQDGQTSSTPDQNSRQHLNPLFAEWLMGWPLQWTNAEPRAFGASGMESYRSTLRWRLSCLLGEQEYSIEERKIA